MCTLMEKDALLEKVASTLAMIARTQEATDTPNADRIAMAELRQQLYMSAPESLDFQDIVSNCNALQSKYGQSVSTAKKAG